MAKTVTITFDAWVEQFIPLKNHFDDNASMDGLMFETNGEEVAYVRAQDINRIWTFTEDDGVIYVGEGMHIVNRLGYAVTEKPYAENTLYVIGDND